MLQLGTEEPINIKNKKVNENDQSHNHRLQANQWHHEEEVQNTDNHNTIIVRQDYC